MARSTIVSEVLLFACSVVLVKIPEITTTTARPLYAKDGFLAGEETPVWLASFEDHYSPSINTEPEFIYWRPSMPIVRIAVDYWNSVKQNGSLPVRPERSVVDSEGFHDVEYDAFWKDPHYTTVPAAHEVVYPSVLVVMHYSDEVLKTYEPKLGYWKATDRALYALAFWNSVDSSLRQIQNPRVSLRIAGIIIVLPAVMQYWGWFYGAKTYGSALGQMMDYWRSLGRKGPNLPIGSYDIVAHMTNIMPQREKDRCSNNFPSKKQILAAATRGPPCNLQEEIAGLIFYDDFAFDGLQRAIGQMSKVLGGNEPPPGWDWHHRSLPNDTLDSISNALKHASCMSAPKEHYPPGRPVAPILAGEVFRSEKQCELLGYGHNAKTCWNSSNVDQRTNCHYLYCSNKYDSDDNCRRSGLTLEGTACNAEETKICLGGRCIDKP